jgi:uncharacterized protein (DUF1499 family)
MRPLPSLLPLLLLAGCSTAPTAELDVNDGRLARCPASPNCVSSQAGDNGSLIAPLRYHVSPQLAWDALVAVVSAQPRATLVTRQAGYLHAEFRSALFRFVDDVEFLAAADEDDDEDCCCCRGPRTSTTDLSMELVMNGERRPTTAEARTEAGSGAGASSSG